MCDADRDSEEFDAGKEPPSDGKKPEQEEDTLRPPDSFASVLNTRLLHRLEGGDEDALGHFLTLEGDRLDRYIERKLPPHIRGPIGTDDIFQQVVITLHQKTEKGDLEVINTPAFLGLVYKIIDGIIAREVKKAHAKKRDIGRKAAVPNPVAGESTAASNPIDDFPAKGETPSKMMHTAEQVATLARCLEELSDEEREILELRESDGLDHPTIANRLGISPEAARQRYHRALARLRILYRAHNSDSL